ncbi:MAG: UvrB/UvrC motif-containing protein [Acidobacteriaceae bacterium]
MAASFHFEHSIPFSPENSTEILRAIPTLPGVFALHGPRSEDQLYLTRAADLRRRITRILAPPDSQSKRLNLRDHVARIDYSVTGSEFESTLMLYHATASIFSIEEARRRLRLHTPFFLRFTAENSYPRVYSTNRLSRRALAHTYGPFPSRAAADRYCDAVLDLFKLRRCYEDLAPYPEHPGCVYQEMNKCLAPCNQACTPAGAAAYAAEAAAVEVFFDTHGESLLTHLTAQREQASADLDFERAAQLHAQFLRVKAAASLADPLVQPIPNLRAVIVQKAVAEPHNLDHVILSEARSAESKDLRFAEPDTEPKPSAALFLVASGSLVGPALLAPAAVLTPNAATDSAANSTSSPEGRVTELLNDLATRARPHPRSAPDLATLSDHLSLLRRWYYRPEKQRTGEVFFPKEDTSDKTPWPIRRILNAAARMALGEPKPATETHRESTPTPVDAGG